VPLGGKVIIFVSAGLAAQSTWSTALIGHL